MRAAKQNMISEAIVRMMLDNKINDKIANETTKQIDECCQRDKYFLYVEIRNTYPRVSYIFNADQPVVVGRDRFGVTICIQDPCISRRHGSFFVYENYVYIRNCSKTQEIKVKKGIRSILLGYDEACYLRYSDRVTMGTAVFQVSLYRGKEQRMN